jgi:hypothetical protein
MNKDKRIIKLRERLRTTYNIVNKDTGLSYGITKIDNKIYSTITIYDTASEKTGQNGIYEVSPKAFKEGKSILEKAVQNGGINKKSAKFAFKKMNLID